MASSDQQPTPAQVGELARPKNGIRPFLTLEQIAEIQAEIEAEQRLEDLYEHPWKRTLLPHCQELALLPIGGDKIPVDLETGRHLRGWQVLSYGIEELTQPNGWLQALAFRPGPESSYIACIDIDGATALAWLLQLGARPEDAGWRILRSKDRLKVPFRIPEELREQLPLGKRVLQTKPKGPNGEPAEQIEFFYGSGQCVIAGRHPSGDIYRSEGNPETVTEPNEAWTQALLELVAQSRTAEPAQGEEPKERWQSGPGSPCPICGRYTGSQCTVWLGDNGDGTTRRGVNCHHGSTFCPPRTRDMGPFGGERPLEKGDEVEIDGVTWAFVREGANSLIGPFSVFVEHRPLQRVAEKKASSPPPKGQLSYKALLNACLEAIVDGDEDRHMQCVAELKNSFRLSDEQIQSRLLRLHMGSKVKKVSAISDGVDLDLIEQLDYAMDGWIPKGAVRMTYGSSGTGKTTLCVWTAHNHAQGINVLDRETPCTPGKALFIATDSGAGPLKKALADLGIDPKTDPLWMPGPDQRVWVWAHAPDQGHDAWLADIRGLIHLETFIQQRGITYVVIDSAKSTTADVFSYTNNESVKSLMRYLQCCICEPLSCCIDWINHDGTEKGSAAGAKAWREDPSMVIRLVEEKDGEDRQIGVRVQFIKDRAAVVDPKRTFVYRLTEGALELAADVEVVGSCEEQVLELLWLQQQGEGPMSTSELKQEALLRYGTAGKTVENTVARMVQARPAKVVRVRRGFYALAPAEAQRRKVHGVKGEHQARSSIGLPTLWGGKESDLLRERESDNPPASPRRGVRGEEPQRMVSKPNPPQAPTGDRPGGCEKPDAPTVLVPTPPSDIGSPRVREGTPKEEPSAEPFAVGARVQVRTLSGNWHSGWEVLAPPHNTTGWVQVGYLHSPSTVTSVPKDDLRLD